MHDQPDLNDPLAAKLARLTPSAAGIDRDSLLFAAGQASARSMRIWPIAAGVLLAANALVLALYLSQTQATIERVVYHDRETPRPALERAPTMSSDDAPRQWTYRKAMLSGDLNDLPASAVAPGELVSDKVWTVLSISAVELN